MTERNAYQKIVFIIYNVLKRKHQVIILHYKNLINIIIQLSKAVLSVEIILLYNQHFFSTIISWYFLDQTGE